MATKLAKNKTKATNKKAAKLKSKKSSPRVIGKKKSVTKKKPSVKNTKVKRSTTKAVVKKATKKQAAKKTTKSTKKPTKKNKKSAAKSTLTTKKVVKTTKDKIQPTKKIKKTKTINKTKDSNMEIELEANRSVIGDYSSRDLSVPSKFGPYDITVQEDYMNEKQQQHFENILENWKKELMLEVDNTITEMKEADILADPNDRATQEETFNLELRTRDRERKLIKKIDAALNKISEQKYGYCDACGVEIGVRRLEARPTATLCIECKTLAEIKEKRT